MDGIVGPVPPKQGGQCLAGSPGLAKKRERCSPDRCGEGRTWGDPPGGVDAMLFLACEIDNSVMKKKARKAVEDPCKEIDPAPVKVG